MTCLFRNGRQTRQTPATRAVQGMNVGARHGLSASARRHLPKSRVASSHGGDCAISANVPLASGAEPWACNSACDRNSSPSAQQAGADLEPLVRAAVARSRPPRPRFRTPRWPPRTIHRNVPAGPLDGNNAIPGCPRGPPPLLDERTPCAAPKNGVATLVRRSINGRSRGETRNALVALSSGQNDHTSASRHLALAHWTPRTATFQPYCACLPVTCAPVRRGRDQALRACPNVPRAFERSAQPLLESAGDPQGAQAEVNPNANGGVPQWKTHLGCAR